MYTMLTIQVLIIAALAWPYLRLQPGPSPTPSPSGDLPSLTPTSSSTPISTASPTPPPPTPTDWVLPAEVPSHLDQGWMVLALNDGGYTHLFAYQPLRLPLTRLTNHPWDDITPAISPQGDRVAFSSRQNGYWDLYLLELASGSLTRLTDTAEYEANPSWSPDGLRLIYESYANNNLNLRILSVEDPNKAPVEVTAHSAADFSPAWSPSGKEIAFVSDRGGEDDIWVIDLDQPEAEAVNLSRDPQANQTHPKWSPDGRILAWISAGENQSEVVVWDRQQPEGEPFLFSQGDELSWSPDGEILAVHFQEHDRYFLSASEVKDRRLLLPPIPLPGKLYGMDWQGGDLPLTMPDPIRQAAQVTPTPLWTGKPFGSNSTWQRANIVPLAEVSLPEAYLHEGVVDAFQVLRLRAAEESGWDFLYNLENTYLPLTYPMPPGIAAEWLYTGRAFTFNPAALSAGWVTLARENLGGETYWRVYLKARYQDGSQGAPLHQRSWDLNARYSGDPLVYDQGGRQTSEVISGYWIDFTDLAERYGWERLPALTHWRSYYPAARFNEWILSGGLDWKTAMLEIYPPEILVTPTPALTPSRTPTRIPTWFQTATLTPTFIPSTTPTCRPTWTPLPDNE